MPTDCHVHSEWSWDAPLGSMDLACEAALSLGLPAVAFTEHVDYTVWMPSAEALASLPSDHPVSRFSDEAGRVTPGAFDPDGYLLAIDRCRSRFPGLRILSGLELGEPHRFYDSVRTVLATGTFDRVLGSVHSQANAGEFQEPGDIYGQRHPADVVRDYLSEVRAMVAQVEEFSVLAHIDYPLRSWPHDSVELQMEDLEDDFRVTLRATAESGRLLEVNTVVPLDVTILKWWHEEGGEGVTFGSDAHEPSRVGAGFAQAAAMAEAIGFRPMGDLVSPWSRT